MPSLTIRRHENRSTVPPVRAARALLALAAAVLLALAGTAWSGPALAATGPRPDAPNGRTITLTNATAQPGGTITFTGTGYINDSGLGQTVTVKLDDVDILGAVEARDDGTVSGSVTIPATLTGSEHWLRFLSGTGKDNDMPPSSLHVNFTLVEAAATTSTSTTTSTTAPGSTVAPTSTSTGGTGGASSATTTPPTTVVGVVGTSVPGALVENGFDSRTLGALGAGLLALGCAGLVIERVVRSRRRAA